MLRPTCPTGPTVHTGVPYEPSYPPGAPVADRISRGSTFWHEISHPCRDCVVRDWIDNGYPLEWGPDGCAPAEVSSNHPSAIRESDFVDEQIVQMLKAGAIKRVYKQRPKVVNPLGTVPKSSGKLRLILDMRHVNRFLVDTTFRMEGLRDLPDIAYPEDFACSVDLAQGYYHIDLHPSSRTYHGFRWRDRWYTYQVLPFGLRTAPRVFAKTFNILVRHWRSQGIRMLAYLDDWLFLASSAGEARRVITQVRRDCLRAHVNINFDKSILVPAHRMEKHLGLTIDFRDKGTFEVPQDRWDRLQADILNLRQKAAGNRRVPVRLVARITGQIISMGLALGNISRLFTRGLYADIDRALTWSADIILSETATQELSFWSETTRDEFTGPIFSPSDEGDAVRLAADASDIGRGGLQLTDSVPRAVAHGFFLPDEREESSTHREARGALLVLRSFQHLCQNRRVLLQVDSLNLFECVHRGSRIPELCGILKSIFWLCLSLHTVLQLVWVPRAENSEADALSKLEDRDDWCLDPRWFRGGSVVHGGVPIRSTVSPPISTTCVPGSILNITARAVRGSTPLAPIGEGTMRPTGSTPPSG